MNWITYTQARYRRVRVRTIILNQLYKNCNIYNQTITLYNNACVFVLLHSQTITVSRISHLARHKKIQTWINPFILSWKWPPECLQSTNSPIVSSWNTYGKYTLVLYCMHRVKSLEHLGGPSKLFYTPFSSNEKRTTRRRNSFGVSCFL